MPTATEDSQDSNTCLLVTDTQYKWIFDYGEDMQLPELPTGCEATAGSTMARMNGILLSKETVADAMPKSSSDFVYSFLGSPYSYNGWSCSAPCLTSTLNNLIDNTEFAAVNLTGSTLEDLPVPSCVWITVDLVQPDEAIKTKDGYGLFKDAHCVVLRYIKNNEAIVIDPLAGDREYPLDTFESVYNALGRQAVYIKTL